MVGWKKVRNQLPFGILQVGRVGLAEFGHSPILPDYLINTLSGPVMQARDKLFVGREPFLLMVDPYSLTIIDLYASDNRDTETWGCV